MRTTPAHARRTRRIPNATHPGALLSVIGLLLLALGIGVLVLPPSFGGTRLGTTAEPMPDRVGIGVEVLGPAPSPSASVAVSTEPSTKTSTGPSSRAPAPSAAPSRRGPTPSKTTAAPVKTAVSGDTALEDQVTALVNQERARISDCPALRTDEQLRTAARRHSQDMATNDYFSHDSQDGRSFVDRIAAAGYPRNQAGGENIAMGYRTPADVMTGWMNSEGHRANILNCSFKAIGVGLGRTSGGTLYWTQDFGRA